MKEAPFRSWMASRYTYNGVNTRLAAAKKVEEQYGDLDHHFDNGTLDRLAERLHYSLSDSNANKPNPTKLTIGGNPYNVLNNCKNAVRTYKVFRSDDGLIEVATEATIELAAAEIVAKNQGKTFELETHLQKFLRDEIEQLESGLVIVDGGNERSVKSGEIDILAQDKNGDFVVIELKKDIARREAIGQIAGYMGDIMREETVGSVRGILIASSFDKSCQSAVHAVPHLSLKRYRYNFMFEEVGQE